MALLLNLARAARQEHKIAVLELVGEYCGDRFGLYSQGAPKLLDSTLRRVEDFS